MEYVSSLFGPIMIVLTAFTMIFHDCFRAMGRAIKLAIVKWSQRFADFDGIE